MQAEHTLKEVDGVYPPRPDVDGPVTYVGVSTPNDGREGDYWMRLQAKDPWWRRLLMALSGR